VGIFAELVLRKFNFPDRNVNDTGFIHTEFHFAGLDFLDGFSHIHRDRTGLGVRHQAARAENLTQTADASHHIGRRNAGIEIHPTAGNLLDKIVAANPEEWERYRAGDPKVSQFLVGQVMRETKGKANGKAVMALLAARKSRDKVTMADFNEAVERGAIGLERKSRIMTQEEKLRVAYHEAGHALVACALPNTSVVHKVTIIPRGVAALGMTYQLPTEDRFLLTRSELDDRIAVLLGGRVAEELVYGEVSTGAHNDLERATELARLMVTKYGMSDRLGLATYGERTPLFLKGAGVGGERDFSDATARVIDEEVRAILDRTQDRVRGVLTAKKAVLVHAAAELKRVETLDGDRLATVLLRPGVMDPAAMSVADAARDLGIPVESVRTFRRYYGPPLPPERRSRRA